MRRILMYGFMFFATIFFLPTASFAHGKEHSKEDGFFGHYSFLELWNPFLFLLVLCIFYVYLIYMKKSRNDKTLPKNKIISFSLGLIILYISLGSPLHILGDSYLFSAHMLQQSLVYIFVPPLILIGLKDEHHEWLKTNNKLINMLKKPLVLLLIFNVFFSFYHIPIIFEFLVANTVLHSISHVLLTMTAFMMWIPIIPPVKELESLTEIQKIGYIFAGGVLLTPACALIIFADTPLYSTYVTSEPLFAILPPLDDQELGGIIMKVAQEIVYGSLIGYIFFNWAKKEEKIDQVIEIN
jgi:putative membrane protein